MQRLVDDSVKRQSKQGIGYKGKGKKVATQPMVFKAQKHQAGNFSQGESSKAVHKNQAKAKVYQQRSPRTQVVAGHRSKKLREMNAENL